MKVCTKCKQEKPETEFYAKGGGAPGLRPHCKACLSTKGRPTTAAERAAKAAAARERRRRDPEGTWRAYLKQYGTTPEWYEEQLARQGGGCAICGEQCKTGKRFAVDHDHSCCDTLPLCGECNRGLLCRGCNVGIGNLGDDPLRLRAAADYLEGF